MSGFIRYDGNAGRKYRETQQRKGMEIMLELNAFGLFVNDLEPMVAFYRDVMGMTADWDGGPYAALTSGSAKLMLYGRRDFEAMTERTYAYPDGLNGTLELAFDVGTVADVDGAYARAVAAGAAPVYPPTDEPWGQRTCYIADPDGNLIEIYAFVSRD